MYLLIFMVPLVGALAMDGAMSSAEETVDCFWIADFFSKRICTGRLTKDLHIAEEHPHLQNGTMYTVWQAVDNPNRHVISFHNPKRFSCEQYNFYTQQCLMKVIGGKKKRKLGLLRSLTNSRLFCYKEDLTDMADLRRNCYEKNALSEFKGQANVHSVFHYPHHMMPPQVKRKVKGATIWDMMPDIYEIAIAAGLMYMLLAIRTLP